MDDMDFMDSMDGMDPPSPGPVHGVHFVHVVHCVHSPLGLEKMMQAPSHSGNLNTEGFGCSFFTRQDRVRTMEALR